MANRDLLLETLHHVAAHSADWGQGDWRTCFAAHAAILAGGRWAAPPGGAGEHLLKPVRSDHSRDVQVIEAGDRQVRGVLVPVRASRVLELAPGEATRLFLPTNDLPRLHLIVSELCEVAA